MLQAILGTKTKLKILEQLCTYPEGLNRHAIAKLSKINVRAVYDQIEDLVFLDVVKRNEKLYYLNKNYPLNDQICSLFVLEKEIMITMEYSIHKFLDNKLKNAYYIGGYDAAIQHVTTLDYTENIVHIGIKRQIYDETLQKLQILNLFDVFSVGQIDPEKISIISFPIDSIPDDIIKGKIHGNDVYIASVTRGVIECFLYPGLSSYGKCLLFLYNLYENLIDINLFNNLNKQGLVKTELKYIIHLSLEHHVEGLDTSMEVIATQDIQLTETVKSSFFHAFMEAKATIYGEE